MLTAYHDDEQMLHAGTCRRVRLFSKRSRARASCLNAIRTVSRGNYVINDEVLAKPQVASWLINQFENIQVGQDEAPEETFRVLSTREMEILKLITRGAQ